MKEISLAENVDSVLSRRAKVEAMNIANRTPGVADVAWKMEKGTIEGAMSNFQKTINKITLYGGTSDDYKDWSNVYHSCLLYTSTFKEKMKIRLQGYIDETSDQDDNITYQLECDDPRYYTMADEKKMEGCSSVSFSLKVFKSIVWESKISS